MSAQDGSAKNSEIDQATEDLQSIATQLSKALKQLETDLDSAIARFDGGFHAGRTPVLGADSGLTSGDASVRHTDVRKLMLARMAASRNSSYEPAALRDMDHLQDVIVKARRHIDLSDYAIRDALIVAADQLGPREQAESKSRHDQLRKARVSAEVAARKAILALPIDLTEAASLTDQKDGVDLIVKTNRDLAADARSLPPSRKAQPPGFCSIFPQVAGKSECPTFPLRWERNRRVTLVREPGYRMALTDPGVEDGHARRVFYQEEWVQRGLAVVEVKRWRVAVDLVTGQHFIVKSYPPRKRLGDIDDGTPPWDRDYLWRLDPPTDSTEPSKAEIESALRGVARERERLRAAIQKYKAAIRDAVANNEQLLSARNQAAPDSGLSASLRERLFAIRGHLGRAPLVLQAEQALGANIDRLVASVRVLESLAAWANRVTNTRTEKGKLTSVEWEILQQRSEDEIDSAIKVRAEARVVLTPDLSEPQAKFPSLENGVIVHISREPPRRSSVSVLRCLQEVWRFGLVGRSGRQVERIVTLIAIDENTGSQTLIGAAVRHYSAAQDDPLEEVFDQYAAQDVPVNVF